MNPVPPRIRIFSPPRPEPLCAPAPDEPAAVKMPAPIAAERNSLRVLIAASCQWPQGYCQASAALQTFAKCAIEFFLSNLAK